jgi:hypothetical protein
MDEDRIIVALEAIAGAAGAAMAHAADRSGLPRRALLDALMSVPLRPLPVAQAKLATDLMEALREACRTAPRAAPPH